MDIVFVAVGGSLVVCSILMVAWNFFHVPCSHITPILFLYATPTIFLYSTPTLLAYYLIPIFLEPVSNKTTTEQEPKVLHHNYCLKVPEWPFGHRT